MTEAELYRKMYPWLARYGYPIRLENSISSGLPDVLYAVDGGLMFIELKIWRSGKIHMPKFQYSTGHVYMKYLDPNNHLIAVGVKDGVDFYRFRQIITGVELVAANGRVTIDLSRVSKPLWHAKSDKDFFKFMQEELIYVR